MPTNEKCTSMLLSNRSSVPPTTRRGGGRTWDKRGGKDMYGRRELEKKGGKQDFQEGQKKGKVFINKISY